MDERSFEDQLEAIWVRHWSTTSRQIQEIVGALLAIDGGTDVRATRDAAASEAHRLIGMAATFSRPHLADLARSSERLLRADELTDGARAELVYVANELDRISTDADRYVAED